MPFLDKHPSLCKTDTSQGHVSQSVNQACPFLNKVNNQTELKYRPFHKTLPRSSAFVNRISVRFYESLMLVCQFNRVLPCVVTQYHLLLFRLYYFAYS